LCEGSIKQSTGELFYGNQEESSCKEEGRPEEESAGQEKGSRKEKEVVNRGRTF
jgi:hypothetical protein